MTFKEQGLIPGVLRPGNMTLKFHDSPGTVQTLINTVAHDDHIHTHTHTVI